MKRRYATLIVNNETDWRDICNGWDQVAKPDLSNVNGRIIFSGLYLNFVIIAADRPILQTDMEVWFEELPPEQFGTNTCSPDDVVVLGLEENPDDISDDDLFAIAQQSYDKGILKPYVNP